MEKRRKKSSNNKHIYIFILYYYLHLHTLPPLFPKTPTGFGFSFYHLSPLGSSPAKNSLGFWGKSFKGLIYTYYNAGIHLQSPPKQVWGRLGESGEKSLLHFFR
jgi:hypothetical protein